MQPDDFEKRWRAADRRHTLDLVLRSWKVLGIGVAIIVLMAFGLSYFATPNEVCRTAEGAVKGLRTAQNARGDFPRHIVTLAMDDGRIVEVATPMSDAPQNGERRLVESCRKTVWGIKIPTNHFKASVPPQ